MIVDKHINKDNWDEIKDILPQITEIKSLDLSYMGLTEFPKMSHITINGDFNCSNNKLTSFKDCPQINRNFYCYSNQLKSFNGCPLVNGDFNCCNNQLKSIKDFPNITGIVWSDFDIFNVVQKYSKEKKISLLDAQVELYNQKHADILEHIDKFPDLVAYIRIKELSKLLS